ncbi:MAG: phosphonate transporter ATP-binding protein [Clostridia bacterium]|jgi:phosphonate transport system ATP-binding protein|nr:phosphonate transporter ATP-binding protein [Clostridia bacterium]
MTVNKMFVLKNISKTYGEMRALSSLSLIVEKGEMIALIGPSGAGKTTLLNILANTILPDSGEVIVDGITLHAYKSTKQFADKVGMIRQQFDLVGHLKVIHNVLAGRLKDWGFFKALLSLIIPQDSKIAQSALEKVGLKDKLYERTSSLSGGEQQRVAMARLLVQKPQAVLADEPVASLDPVRAEDILYMLTKLASEEQQTLIASLHSVEYARKYFKRIIALQAGRVYFDLPVEKVTEELLSSLYSLEEEKQHE